MEVKLQTTREDYDAYFKRHFRQSLKSRLPRIILILIVLLAVSGIGTYTVFSFTVTVLLYAALIVLIGFIIPYSLSVKKLNRAIAEKADLFTEKKLTLDNDGIILEATAGNTRWDWKDILKIYKDEYFISIIVGTKKAFSPKKLILIPVACFESETQADQFAGRLQRDQYKVKKGYMNYNKPPYNLGWLGIIPLVGAFVGAGLVLNGIFKYRDKS